MRLSKIILILLLIAIEIEYLTAAKTKEELTLIH